MITSTCCVCVLMHTYTLVCSGVRGSRRTTSGIFPQVAHIYLFVCLLVYLLIHFGGGVSQLTGAWEVT